MLALIPHGPIAGRFVPATPKEDTMYAQLTYFDGPRSPEQVALLIDAANLELTDEDITTIQGDR